MDDILNWLWQGCLVALATEATIRVLDLSQARVRYGVWQIALLIVLALPLVPFFWTAVSSGHVAGANAPARVVPVFSMPSGWWTSSAAVIVLWLSWSSIFISRLTAAILALRRARARCRKVSPHLEARLPFWTRVQALAARGESPASHRGRPTRLAVSDSVRSAAVLGFGAPVIAIAPALLEHLTDEELDRVVIHEWAHVQRRDDVAHLVQLLTRAVAGWHPALWWIGRQLTIEREVACDETAVGVTGSAKGYAACLAKLASLSLMPLQSVPAPGALSSSGLRRRIVRILALNHVASPASSRPAVTGAVVWLCTLALALGGLRLIETAASASAVETLLHSTPAVHAVVSAVTGAEARRPIAEARSSSGRTDPPEYQASSSSSRRASYRRAQPGPAATAPATVPLGATTDSTRPFAEDQAVATALSGSTPPRAALESSRTQLELPVLVANQTPAPDVTPVSSWSAAADAGVAVGRRSQKAAVGTAGFVSRVGKKIADFF